MSCSRYCSIRRAPTVYFSRSRLRSGTKSFATSPSSTPPYVKLYLMLAEQANSGSLGSAASDATVVATDAAKDVEKVGGAAVGAVERVGGDAIDGLKSAAIDFFKGMKW